MFLFTKTKAKHDTNLRAVLQRCREKGLKLNPDKLAVCHTEVDYLGRIISVQGVARDCVTVGMITYIAKFTPSLSEVTASLRMLSSSRFEFVLTEIDQKLFKIPS